MVTQADKESKMIDIAVYGLSNSSSASQNSDGVQQNFKLKVKVIVNQYKKNIQALMKAKRNNLSLLLIIYRFIFPFYN